MYDLIIVISRYIFLVYIMAFFFLGILIILKTRGKNANMTYIIEKKYITMQHIIILLFHITAFLILAYDNNTLSFNTETLIIYGAIIFLFILAKIIISIFSKHGNNLLYNCIFFLSDIGIVTLESLNPALAKKQIIWIFAGFIALIIIPFIFEILPNLKNFKYIYIGLSILMLGFTLLFGNEEGGATNWLTIKDITFQPSEIIKILFVLYISAELAKPRIKKTEIIFSALMTGIIIIGFVFQKDLGSALIFFMTYMIVLFITTSSHILFFGGLTAASIASVFVYKIFSHVQTRVAIWQNPWSDITNKGYQITQSLFALTTWGLFGCGLKKGMSTKIPVVEKDFIFSAICEEFGILFGILIILLFMMTFFCGVKISLNSRNRFLSVFVSGITCLMCFQTFLIIGGVTKFIPMTGVTLPFISYGGTSMIISFSMIGMIQSVCKDSYEKLEIQ